MKYDTIIIGAGPGGIETARVLARNGKRVAIVEKDSVGGICVNRGCIPAKTMLYSAEMFRTGKKIRDYGIRFCEDTPSYNFKAMMEHRAVIMEKVRSQLIGLIENDGVELIYGFAELVGENKVLVDGGKMELEAEHIVLATGGDARRFPGYVDGDDRFMVSDNIFGMQAFPESIFIVGAGPVGTEFATFFNTFGVKVYILDRSDTFLGHYDSDLGDELIKNFEAEGITCYTADNVVEVDASGERIKVKVESGDTVEVESMLSAIGMVPCVKYVKIDVDMDKAGRFVVNKSLQTSVPNIYSIGDANGLSGSAYGAEREGLYVAHHILGDPLYDIPLDYASFPDVVFCDPEVASCGLSEKDCKDKGIDYVCAKASFEVNGKAQIKGDTRGFCKVIAERGSQKILGVHIIGPTATEIVHTAVFPVRDGLRVGEWLRKVWGHPVLAEVVKEALIAVEKKL